MNLILTEPNVYIKHEEEEKKNSDKVDVLNWGVCSGPVLKY